MFDLLKSDLAKHAVKAAILPIHRLEDIRQDLSDLKDSAELNNFQQYILKDLYSLDVTETRFEVRSIIITASPSPATVTLQMTWKGKRIPVMLPASYAGKNRTTARVEEYLNAFLQPSGYYVRYAPKLPHKLIAVRSGLGLYGRNNICYVEGLGSFLNLSPFFSDLPCTEDTWQEIRQMDICRTCPVCLQNCPTAAIMPARFLIDNERCLTYFNEAGAEWNFPEWVDASSHHTLYGCLRCQIPCPVNKPYVKTTLKPVEFSEQETNCLLEMKPFDQFPEGLRQKVVDLEMESYLGAVPRNLRAIFNRTVG